MNGQLSEQPLAELIREINATGLSGALRLVRERVRAVVYAQAGAIIHARTNLRAHRLTECLRRWEFLTAEQLQAFGSAAMTEPEVCTALVNAGVIKQDALPGLRLRQLADILRPLLLWTDGTWSFDARARLAEETAGALPVADLLLEGARRLPAEFAAARLADTDVFTPTAAPPANLALLPTEGFILSRVDAPLTLAELVAVSGLPETETRHAAYALALAGLLTRAAWPAMFDAHTQAQARATAPASADAATKLNQPPTTTQTQTQSNATKSAEPPAPAPEADPQAEIAALLARVRGADNYELLGIARRAEAGEIKRAYYALAKRFHPDRFRRDADETQRGRVETAFAKIAQAYETLSDEKTRTAYDAKLPPESLNHPPAREAPQPSAPSSSSAAAPPAEAAETHYAAARKESAEENFQQGLAALKQNNYHAAALRLAAAVYLAPKQARYHAYYGSALAHEPRTRHQAETELQAAIRLDAANASYHVMLAELYQRLGQTRRAETELTLALTIDPRNDAARQLLAKQKKL
ncbi:MAG: DnaJ domain-containing protein [Pyrinomonadaceae bacterium]